MLNRTTTVSLLLILLLYPAFSQRVEWANEVIKFSSQFDDRQYSANQVLGKPDVLPNLGLSPNAWSPSKKKGKEYIKVGFKNPIQVRQVAIAETNNPGGLKKIYVYDEEGNEHLVNTFFPSDLPLEGRLLRIYIEKTEFNVSAVKIEIDGSVLKGYYAIDAIGISDSKDPISFNINLTNEIDDNYIPIPLNPTINSEFNELRPMLSPDGNTLFFSRQNHPENSGGVSDLEDIWISKRDSTSDRWLDPVNIGKPLNNRGPNYISSILELDSQVWLLLGNAYYGKNRMTQGASIAFAKADGSWSKPKNLDIKKGYNLSPLANYFLAKDMETVVMSIERKDSEGARDLYVSFLKDDGSWSEPLNMGHVINSADEESAPFLSNDGNILYFSSKGFSGFGGYDIFLSRRLDDTWTNWSEPENLGLSFNSTQDDIFFNFTGTEEYAYFSRGTKDNTDIYRVKLPQYQKPELAAYIPGAEFNNPNIIVRVKGTVFNAKTKNAIKASLEFRNLDNGDVVELTNSEEITGKYEVVLKEEFDYLITTKKDSFYTAYDTISTKGIIENTEILKDIYLDPVEINVPVRLNNIYFAFDSDVLKSESFPYLDRLAEFLLDHPKLKISVEGHTCAIGTDAYNLDLSSRRTASIVRYLNTQGVEKERMKSEGFGESQPIATNQNEAGRIKNRRVEFQLSDYDPNKYTPVQIQQP